MRYLGQVLEIKTATYVAHLLSDENPDEFIIVEYPLGETNERIVVNATFYVDSDTIWEPHFPEPLRLSADEIALREAQLKCVLGLGE